MARVTALCCSDARSILFGTFTQLLRLSSLGYFWKTGTLFINGCFPDVARFFKMGEVYPYDAHFQRGSYTLGTLYYDE